MAADETDHAARDETGRDETPIERLDRNWIELLQELRVIQTGVQLLTGFLLTLPFQQRFPELGTGERVVYLATAAASILATIFLQAPVMVHRALFQRHRRKETVYVAHRLAVVGMALLGCAVTGVTCLITAVLTNFATGGISAAVTVVLVMTLWVVIPLRMRRSRPPL